MSDASAQYGSGESHACRNLIEAQTLLAELRGFDAEGMATFIERDRGLLDEEVEIEKVSRNEYKVRQKARNPRLFPDPASLPVEIDEARAEEIDPLLVTAIIAKESSFKTRVVSHAGAVGLASPAHPIKRAQQLLAVHLR